MMGDDHALLREALLVVFRGVHDDRGAQHTVTLRQVAHRKTVEGAGDRRLVELADEPADRPREAQVVLLTGRPLSPAHAARDLEATDQARHEAGQDGRGRFALGLDTHGGELRAVDDRAAHVLGRRAARTRESLAGLGEPAVRVERDLRLGATEVVDLGDLPLGHAANEHRDAPRRDEDVEIRRLACEDSVFGQHLGHQPRRAVRALELADHRLADPVGQLLAADLDQESAHASDPGTVPALPLPTTSRYRPAVLRARSRTRLMCAVRSVTLITPRASSMLKAWLHLST